MWDNSIINKERFFSERQAPAFFLKKQLDRFFFMDDVNDEDVPAEWGRAQQLKEAVENGDYDAFGKTSHKLKGTTKTLFIVKVADTATRLNDYSKDGIELSDPVVAETSKELFDSFAEAKRMYIAAKDELV